MTDLKKILVGIRNSKLSRAQTDNFFDQAYALPEFNSHYALEIKTIKTTGDNNPMQRLDKIGGKGLFAKEIENEIISGQVDIGVHSMKDLPASEFMKEAMQFNFNKPSLFYRLLESTGNFGLEHRWMYDSENISKLLLASKFKIVEKIDNLPSKKYYETYAAEEGNLQIFAVKDL